MMPGIDGYEFTRRIKQKPETSGFPVIMLTSLGQRKDKIMALESGVDDFLNKPVDKTELTLRVKGFLKVKKYNDALAKEKESLEKMLNQKENVLVNTIEELKTMSEDKTLLLKLLEEESVKLIGAYKKLKESNTMLKRTSLEMIQALATAAEFRDNETGSHIQRMGNYCMLIAQKLGMSEDQCQDILYTSSMHDIGKIGIPDNILMKPGALDNNEWGIMKTHAYIGYKILSNFKTELMQLAGIIAYSHHEKWDGSGYPRGLKGQDIPMEGRICAIADVFDALTSKRVYKEAFSVEKALDILKEGRAKHFDPDFLDIFFDSFDEVLAIKKKYTETEEELEKQRIRLEAFEKQNTAG
jgi:putative two-component system response regulator